MIAALIFDFDGLIVDTESPAFSSWQMIYAEYGFSLDFALWQDSLGTSHGFDALQHLIALSTQRDPALGAEVQTQAQAIGLRRQLLKDELSFQQPILPGVVALLDAAAARGMPCAVASSSSLRWVGGWLDRLGIRGRFACVRTSDDVGLDRTKPHPDLFLSAAAGLDVPPAQCLVLEDSPNGVLAAQRAGMRCVAIPGPVTRPLTFPPSDLVLNSLADLSLAEILERLA